MAVTGGGQSTGGGWGLERRRGGHGGGGPGGEGWSRGRGGRGWKGWWWGDHIYRQVSGAGCWAGGGAALRWGPAQRLRPSPLARSRGSPRSRIPRSPAAEQPRSPGGLGASPPGGGKQGESRAEGPERRREERSIYGSSPAARRAILGPIPRLEARRGDGEPPCREPFTAGSSAFGERRGSSPRSGPRETL